MIKVLRIVALILTCTLAACSATENNPQQSAELAGGGTTVFDVSANAFSLPAANLSISRRDRFSIGNSFFRNPWVTAPSSTSARDGLGPLYNTNTCQSCHIKDGRGRPPVGAEPFISLLVRLSVPAASAADELLLQRNGVVPEPVYGGQLNSLAISGIDGEGDAVLHYEYIPGQFSDGEKYELRRPILTIDRLKYGPLHPATMTSVRTAPAMIGLGLLEAIAEQDILAHADAADADNDGISGRPNRVWDIARQQTVLGRFGWKAGQPTVKQQAAAAFNGDIGITSSLFRDSSCSERQLACRRAPTGGEPEISDEILEFVTFYAKTLAVSARRDIATAAVQRGERLFQAAACAQCHVPHFTTGHMEGFP
ncbi:MAG TPA: di-heme oxidoredictase family protein, partial [Gammaproteobacteria bacterium]